MGEKAASSSPLRKRSLIMRCPPAGSCMPSTTADVGSQARKRSGLYGAVFSRDGDSLGENVVELAAARKTDTLFYAQSETASATEEK